MDFSQIDFSSIIIDTINKIFSELFSSVDNTLFSLLDTIVFIDDSIVKDSFFEKAFGSNYGIGLISIADALLLGFVIYYCIKLTLSHYTGENIESPYSFIAKTIIFVICVNCSGFICQYIIYINSLLCDSIREIGSAIFGTKISFSNFITQMNSFVLSSSFDVFSFDGIIKSFVSFGLLNLLFSYSLRFILIKIFIIISPFSFLSLTVSSTSWFFKSWIRNFLSLLLQQSFISLVFLLIFSFDGTFSSDLSRLMYIGSVYALMKSSQYVRALIGGISTDISVNIGNMKNIIK